MMELKKCCNHCYLVRPPEDDLNKVEALQVRRLCHFPAHQFPFLPEASDKMDLWLQRWFPFLFPDHVASGLVCG